LSLQYIIISREKSKSLIVSILGLILCVLWYINIQSYKQLNAGKFEVIRDIEQYLPYLCYSKEWKILGEGKESKKYFQLTKVEQYVPLIFFIPYVLMLSYFFVNILS
jgi:hypothetical protein